MFPYQIIFSVFLSHPFNPNFVSFENKTRQEEIFLRLILLRFWGLVVPVEEGLNCEVVFERRAAISFFTPKSPLVCRALVSTPSVAHQTCKSKCAPFRLSCDSVGRNESILKCWWFEEKVHLLKS
jgi:hypothetical protein